MNRRLKLAASAVSCCSALYHATWSLAEKTGSEMPVTTVSLPPPALKLPRPVLTASLSAAILAWDRSRPSGWKSQLSQALMMPLAATVLAVALFAGGGADFVEVFLRQRVGKDFSPLPLVGAIFSRADLPVHGTGVIPPLMTTLLRKQRKK